MSMYHPLRLESGSECQSFAASLPERRERADGPGSNALTRPSSRPLLQQSVGVAPLDPKQSVLPVDVGAVQTGELLRPQAATDGEDRDRAEPRMQLRGDRLDLVPRLERENVAPFVPAQLRILDPPDASRVTRLRATPIAAPAGAAGMCDAGNPRRSRAASPPARAG
jgi:hypothetical protein